MPYIIIKNSQSGRWNKNKDFLHQRRKELEQDLKQTIFTKDQMNMVDCKSETEEHKRTLDFMRWQKTRDKSGKTNEEKQREWHNINRTFKKHNEEGRIHTTDDLRNSKQTKYD